MPRLHTIEELQDLVTSDEITEEFRERIKVALRDRTSESIQACGFYGYGSLPTQDAPSAARPTA
jgi:hypothetical protein